MVSVSAINAFNTYLAPVCVLLIILLDYSNNRNADTVQRRIFYSVCICTILTMAFDILYYATLNIPDASVVQRAALHVALFGFFAMQQASVTSLATLFDYTVNQSVKRLKTVIYILVGVNVINNIILAVNVKAGWLFTITPDNEYVKNSLYFLLPAFAYLPILITVIDMLLSYKSVTRHQVRMIFGMLVPIVVASALDLFVPGFQAQRPFACAALLFLYIFLVRFEYRLDSLTGINNRRACDDYLHTLTRSAREPYLFAIIDVDFFKAINDTYGHAQGDVALRDVASILKSATRSTDFLGRYGGDEFLIILRSPPPIETMVNRINRLAAEHNQKKNRPFTIQLSIGCDIFDPSKGHTPLQFLEHVDQLMYIDKKRQKN